MSPALYIALQNEADRSVPAEAAFAARARNEGLTIARFPSLTSAVSSLLCALRKLRSNRGFQLAAGADLRGLRQYKAAVQGGAQVFVRCEGVGPEPQRCELQVAARAGGRANDSCLHPGKRANSAELNEFCPEFRFAQSAADSRPTQENCTRRLAGRHVDLSVFGRKQNFAVRWCCSAVLR